MTDPTTHLHAQTLYPVAGGLGPPTNSAVFSIYSKANRTAAFALSLAASLSSEVTSCSADPPLFIQPKITTLAPPKTVRLNATCSMGWGDVGITWIALPSKSHSGNIAPHEPPE
jgi:hypothetical protein